MGSRPWLKEGQHTLPLHVDREQLEDAGPFAGGGLKTLWHTTEGGTLASVVQTLRAKRAGVHFAIDPHTGHCVQMIPLDRAGRGLEHTDGPETNRANCIQIEIVGFAAQTKDFGDREYRHLAALALAIEHHGHKTPRRVRNFTHPKKFSGTEFVSYAGHCGHVHVPGNSHYDPGTGFRGRKLVREITVLDGRS
jgi:hypothetical protein